MTLYRHARESNRTFIGKFMAFPKRRKLTQDYQIHYFRVVLFWVHWFDLQFGQDPGTYEDPTRAELNTMQK